MPLLKTLCLVNGKFCIFIICNQYGNKLKARTFNSFMKTAARPHAGEFNIKELTLEDTDFPEWWFRLGRLPRDTEEIFEDEDTMKMFDVLWEEATDL